MSEGCRKECTSGWTSGRVGCDIYLCGFLERAALTRVRNSQVMSVKKLFACMQNALEQKWNYLELEKKLHGRVQQQHKSVWKFVGTLLQMVLSELERQESWSEVAEVVGGIVTGAVARVSERSR